MKKKNRHRKTIIIISIILFLVVVQTLPVFFMKPWGSKTLSNDFIILNYQPGDEKGANEVFELLNEKSESIYKKMNYVSKDPIKVYLYKTQFQLAIREAGLITVVFAPPWYIGDSHNGNIMMLSPNTPAEEHTHDSILTATLHELVHSINYQINSNLSYFWDNGLATYLAEQYPAPEHYDKNKIPSIEDMHTENGLKFGEMGGYAYSYFYIQYLDETYGWDKIVAFTKGDGDYEKVFDKSEEEIYNEWVEYLKDMNN
ncbi:MAG TPA: hypothetical protein VJY54_04965 [Lachnospiraceae bacterium]|nr:hypothetical protein [Lachnospiraceae bacterium]